MTKPALRNGDQIFYDFRVPLLYSRITLAIVSLALLISTILVQINVESIQKDGIDGIESFQEWGSWTKYFTILGNAEFYTVFIPFLMFCFSFNFGIQFAASLFINSFTGAFVKDLFQGPRPTWIVSSDSGMEFDSSDCGQEWGMPSLHAWSSVTCFGLVALYFTRECDWWGARSMVGRLSVYFLTFIICVLVGLSRMALAVHFPHQVYLGWLTGIFMLAWFVWAQPSFDAGFKWLNAKITPYATSVLLGIIMIIFALFPSWVRNFPDELDAWNVNLADWGCEEEIDPYESRKLMFTMTGLFHLFPLVQAFQTRFQISLFSMSRIGTIAQHAWSIGFRLFLFLSVAAVSMGLFIGLGEAIPKDPLTMALIVRYYLRGVLMVVVLILAMPYFYVRLGWMASYSDASSPGREDSSSLKDDKGPLNDVL